MSEDCRKLFPGESYAYWSLADAYNVLSCIGEQEIYVDENNLLHNPNGPALKDNNNIRYAIHGRFHRLDGPAMTIKTVNGTVAFYSIHGKSYTEEEFNKYISGVDKDLLDDYVDMDRGFD